MVLKHHAVEDVLPGRPESLEQDLGREIRLRQGIGKDERRELL